MSLPEWDNGVTSLSLNEIRSEFGGVNPVPITRYYGVDTDIPTKGQISIKDFYGASGYNGPASPVNTAADKNFEIGEDLPSDVKFTICICGGGGGGGGGVIADSNTYQGGGGGGGSGSLTIEVGPLNKGQILNIGIGAGGREGNGGTIYNRHSSGHTGGTSWVAIDSGAPILQAVGGKGGRNPSYGDYVSDGGIAVNGGGNGGDGRHNQARINCHPDGYPSSGCGGSHSGGGGGYTSGGTGAGGWGWYGSGGKGANAYAGNRGIYGYCRISWVG